MEPVNLAEFEALARAALPPLVWDYIAGGAEDEQNLSWNTAAFRRIQLRPRVLVDVRSRDLTTHLFGQQIALPVLLAPAGHHRMVHPDAELAVARAAAAAGTIAVFGTGSHHSIDEVAAASSGPRWFQFYCYDSRGVTERIMRRAEAAGCLALVATVDGGHYHARRERDIRNRWALPQGVELRNLLGIGMDDELMRTGGSAAFLRSVRAMPPTWEDIGWMRSITRLPLLLKGIMTGEDARLAIEHGADGVIVSNHGGRQIDGTPASIEVLPEVVAAVAGRGVVLLDSGVRRGTDVLKALALGAQAVLIGRPYLWGLAAGG
ncbi:MAG TPA: alpha-hydroxy acid oxidase, partial [Roseiflexaceae bacterium]|nr:alpha-hydroxy acid oxidase [Roseiflexaceae bacterium]